MLASAPVRDPAVARSSSWGALVVGTEIAALVASFGIHLFKILQATHAQLVARLPDDAFYYLEIARHLARGDGFTFDGVHRTNGFHPLWQLLLVPLARLIADDDALVKAALVLGLVIVFASLALLIALARDLVGLPVALLAGLVTIHFALWDWVNGMEGPVVVATLTVLAWTLTRDDTRRTAWSMAAVGGMSFLCVMARLDLAAVVPIVPVAIGLRRRVWRPVLWWAGSAAAPALVFGLWWLASWGPRLLTTSATVKQHWATDTFDRAYGGRFTSEYLDFFVTQVRSYGFMLIRVLTTPAVLDSLADLLLVVVAGLTIVGLWSLRGRPVLPLPPAAWGLVVVVVMVLAKTVVDFVTAPLWAESWYSAPQRFFLPFVVVCVATRGALRLGESNALVRAVALAPLAVLALPVNLNAGWDLPQGGPLPWQPAIDQAADWVLAEGPDGRYGALDSGLLGFRLDRKAPVANLDGLVNDPDFARLVIDNASTLDKLRYNDVDFLVNRLTGPALADLSCGSVLWRSPEPVPYGDTFNPFTSAPVYVVDVRPCLAG